MGYLRVRDPDEREGMSSGSSSHSGSPGGGERSAVTGGGKEAEEGEEEGERGRKREGRRGIRQGYGEGMSEMGAALSNPLSAGSRGHGGRSDSLGRGQRPGYYQLKKYPSNDSLSSSSTLVSKLNAYEHDDNLVDILRPASSGQGLTQSNVQDHLQFEARKNKRLRSRPPRQATAEEEQGGPAYGYMRRREKFVEGRERSDRVGDDGRGRERRGKEEVDGREDEGECGGGGGGEGGVGGRGEWGRGREGVGGGRGKGWREGGGGGRGWRGGSGGWREGGREREGLEGGREGKEREGGVGGGKRGLAIKELYN